MHTMKANKFKYWGLIIAINILCSCSNKDIKYISEQATLSSRTMVNEDNVSISNPDLLSHWENISDIFLNSFAEYELLM